MMPLLMPLIAVIGALHICFLILEMFFWTKPIGLKIFRQSLEKAKSSQVLAANQGLYNGFLAAGLFWSLFYPSPEVAKHLQLFFLGCVIIAGIYGGLSVHRKIFFIQAFPAIFAFAFLILG